MNIVTGVDIIKINRLAKSIQNPRFIPRIYSPREQNIYREKGEPLSFLAGNFAAKEAFSKALGTGVRGFKLVEVEALRDPLGRPYFALSGQAKQLAEDKGLTFSLSIAHEQEYAVAFVTGWSNNQE